MEFSCEGSRAEGSKDPAQATRKQTRRQAGRIAGRALLIAIYALVAGWGAVLGAAPAAGDAGVVPDDFLRRWDPLTIFFDADRGPSDAAFGAVAETDPDALVRIEPAHPGAWTWLDRRTLQFRPADPWPALQRFRVEVEGGKSVRLATLMTAPEQTEPRDGRESVEEVESLLLTFEEPLDPDSLARALLLELHPLPGLDASAATFLDAEDFEIKVLERSTRGEPASYLVALQRPLPLGRSVAVHLQLSLDPLPMASSGAIGGDGAATTGTGRVTVARFTTAEPFRVVSFGCRAQRYPVTPEGSRYAPDRAIRCEDRDPAVQLELTARLGDDVGPLAARNLVRLSPSVDDLRVQAVGRNLLLRGDFERDVAYLLRLEPGAGFRDARGRELDLRAPAEVHLVFPSRAPYLRWTEPRGIVERFGPRMAPVEGRGDERMDLRIHPIDPLDRDLWPFPDTPLTVDEAERPPGPGELPEPIRDPRRDPSPSHVAAHLRDLPAPPVSTLVDLPLAGGETARFGLDLEPHLEAISGTDRPGAWAVGLRRLDGGGQRSWMRLQATDLALSTVEEGKRVVFVVTSVRDASPVAGAVVKVEAAVRAVGGGQRWETLYRGTTDSTGRAAWTPPVGSQPGTVIRRIVVEKTVEKETTGDVVDRLVLDPAAPPDRFYDGAFTDDTSRWLQWTTGNLHRRGEDVRPLAHVFTERPVYRPEQPVHLQAYVRFREGGRYEVPRSGARFEVQGPGGRSWHFDRPADAHGSFHALFEGDETETPSGAYRVRVRVPFRDGHWWSDWVSFRKEAYRLPRFEVRLDGPKDDRATLDESFRVALVATYYAGGRVSEQPVRWRVTQFPLSWSPPEKYADDFVFSSDGRYSRTDGFRSTPALDKADVTDADGGAVLEVDPTLEPTAQPRTYVVEATVTGVDDQTVTATRRIRALPPFLLGLDVPRYLPPEESLRVAPRVLAVGGDGEPRAGQPLTVRLLHRQWHSHLRASDFTDGVARYVTDVVDEEIATREVESLGEALEVPFDLPEPGVYVVEVESRDRLGRLQTVALDLFAAGAGEQALAWSRPKTRILEIATDQARYAPGDVARLVLQSPFQSARALVVVETPGENDYHWVWVEGGQGVFELPVEGEWAPRLPVHVLLYRGRVEGTAPRPGNAVDLGKPTTLGATEWLEVEPRAQTVEVELEHPEEAQPGRAVEVTVNLRSPEGEPLPGLVTLWLVDRAVLALGREQRLDPIPDFVQAEPSHVSFHDTRGRILGYLPYAEIPGGGEGAAEEELLDRVTVRKNFQPVPFYDPAIEVDAGGTATVRVELPDNLTDFALRAKALSGPSRFGHAKSRLAVRLPVIVQPALPRFLRPGDEFVAAAVGRLVSGEPGPGRAQARFDGVEMTGPDADERASRDLNWLPGTPRRLEFPVRVPSPVLDEDGRPVRDEATFRVAVERLADGAADAFEVKIPIRDDRERAVERELVQLAAGESVEWPAIREPSRPGSLRRALLASDRPALVRMVAGLDALMRYPYGCTEQRISRERARIALRKLRGALAADAVVGEEPEALARSFAETQEWIRRSLDGAGRVSYWPGDRGYLHLTAWSAELLTEARDAARSGLLPGLQVDEDLLQTLLRTLEQGLRSDYSGFVSGAAWTERTMALRALARAGRHDAAYGAELARKAQFLGPGGVARILVAGAAAGETASADRDRLVRQLWDAVVFRLEHGERVYGGLQREDGAQPALILPSETRTVAEMVRALRGLGLGVADPVGRDGSESAEKDDLARFEALVDGLVRLGRGDGWGSTQADAAALLALAEVLQPPFPSPERELRVRWKGEGEEGGGEDVLRLGPDAPSVARVATRADAADLSWTASDADDDAEDELILRLESSWIPSAPGAEMTSERNGFVVERAWKIYDRGAPRSGHGAPPRNVELNEPASVEIGVGTVVEEAVRVVNARDRHHVAVVIPLAAGMEALNPHLATAPPEATPEGGVTRPPSYADFRDDHVAFYYVDLPKGTYDFHFRARATTEGRFGQPPARAEMMYDAAVWGRSAGAWISVTRPAE